MSDTPLSAHAAKRCIRRAKKPEPLIERTPSTYTVAGKNWSFEELFVHVSNANPNVTRKLLRSRLKDWHRKMEFLCASPQRKPIRQPKGR